MRAEYNRATSSARQLQRMIREQVVDIVRIDDIRLKARKQLAEGAGRLRIPKREPGAKAFRIAGMNMVGRDALADFFKGDAVGRGGDVRLVPGRRDSFCQTPDDRFRPALAFRRDSIVEQQDLHPARKSA